jgi:hypothetical protein
MVAIVTGMIASYPVGGVLWDYGQYALGLERLGFEVYYLEDTGWQTYDPSQGVYTEACDYAVKFLRESLARLSPNLGRRWHFRNMDGRTFGLEANEFMQIVAEADLFLNVSGGTLLRDAYLQNKRKVLIDTDPGWNHFRNYPRWDANPHWQGSHGYRAHDFFFTYAERLGRRDCVLPELGLKWQPTRPPVVLDCWQPRPPGEKWTTVLTWKNFQETISYQGVTYGTKEMEFSKVQDLPARTRSKLELAVGGAAAPIDQWRAAGWSVIDAASVSPTPDRYQQYVESSRGEFSVAKNIYAATRSGWFSCRSACYLAASRPVVVQDTGWPELIPAGEGLLAFQDLAGAQRALDAVEKGYARHQQAARAAAVAYFDSDKVLGELLERVNL